MTNHHIFISIALITLQLTSSLSDDVKLETNKLRNELKMSNAREKTRRNEIARDENVPDGYVHKTQGLESRDELIDEIAEHIVFLETRSRPTNEQQQAYNRKKNHEIDVVEENDMKGFDKKAECKRVMDTWMAECT
eukprot:g49.t1